MVRRLVAAQLGVKRAHRRAQLQPDRFGHRQHRRGLGAQVQRAVKLQIGADIGHGILLGHGLGIGGIDGFQPFDQREMGARQGARGQFRLQQRADRRQFLDPVGRQLGGRDAARGGHGEGAFGDQPPHRLARRRHRHAKGLGQPAQGQRLTRRQFPVHHLHAQRAVQPVMFGKGGVRRTRLDQHAAKRTTRRRAGQSPAEAKRCPCSA